VSRRGEGGAGGWYACRVPLGLMACLALLPAASFVVGTALRRIAEVLLFCYDFLCLCPLCGALSPPGALLLPPACVRDPGSECTKYVFHSTPPRPLSPTINLLSPTQHFTRPLPRSCSV